MQKLTLIGNLGNDPKIKEFENGGKIATFSVADTQRERKLKDGTIIPARTTWFDCVAKGSTVKFVEDYCKKGLLVYIEAKMQTRSYNDKNGAERNIKEFVVKEIHILTPKKHCQDPVPAVDPYPGEPVDTHKAPEDELPF